MPGEHTTAVPSAEAGTSQATSRAQLPDRENEVEEYETLESIPLSAPELKGLRRHHPKIKVRPSLSTGYDITATSWIGSLTIGGLKLRIRPKIHIRRVLFLVSYALDPDNWLPLEAEFGRQDTLLEAMAPGFLALCRKTLSRGMRRGYHAEEEALQTVRGRIRFDAQVKRRFGRFPPAEVAYDEFTADIDENRMLLAALERLGRLHLDSVPTRRGIRRLKVRFQGVSPVDYSGLPLPEITFTRLNEHYRPSLRLARLILRNTSIAHERGEVRSSAFLLDMNQLFEDFVVVALRDALALSTRQFPQECAGRELWLDPEERIALEPDLSWWRAERPIFVGDVKYKRLGKKARNADLYQLLAYLTAADLPTGMLVYGESTGSPEVHRVRHSSKRLQVLGLDLDQEPTAILDDVNRLAERIRSSAESITISRSRSAPVPRGRP